MAYNALYGYDTGTFGYGGANGVDPTQPYQAMTQRKYPAWWSDLNARGIGNDETQSPATPAFIDVPHDYAASAVADQTAAAPVQTGYAAPMTQQGMPGDGVGGNQNGTGNPGNGFGLMGDIKGLAGGLYDAVMGNGGGTSSQGITDAGYQGPGNVSSEPLGPAGGGTDINAGGADPTGGQGPAGLYKGGIVTRNKLMGPNPPGPDDGYEALKVGEGVLTDKAMRFYGPAIVAKLNRLQVPKRALA